MNFNTPVLDQDLTGDNPDNRIPNEVHTLSDRPTRSVAPLRGPFFARNLVVEADGVVLRRGIDYQLVELHQELTLLADEEINSVILILARNIGPTVSITYNAVGGHYGRNDAAIANLFETVLNDNRPVPWNNLFNKPTEFNPTNHRHLLDDVFGFEPVVDYLERIKRAITLGQTSVVLEIVNALLSKFNCGELNLNLPSNKLIQYDSLLYYLSRRKIISNIWIDTVGCSWIKGQNAEFQIDTSGYPVGTPLFWEFYREGGEMVTLFTQKEGMIYGDGGVVTVRIYVPADLNSLDANLYLGVKADKSAPDYLAVTYVLVVSEPVVTDSMYGYMLMNPQDYSDFHYQAALYVTEERRLWYMTSHY